MGVAALTGALPAQADDVPTEANVDMAFIEFLGEGIDVENEYIDPVRLDEYEQMINRAAQEVKQQDD